MFAILKMVWLVITHKNNPGVLSSYRLQVNCMLKRLFNLFISVQHQKRPSFSLRINKVSPCHNSFCYRADWWEWHGTVGGWRLSLKECIRHITEGDECWMSLYKPLNSAAVKPHIKQSCATIYKITWELEAVTESQRHNDLKGGQKFIETRPWRIVRLSFQRLGNTTWM